MVNKAEERKEKKFMTCDGNKTSLGEAQSQ